MTNSFLNNNIQMWTKYAFVIVILLSMNQVVEASETVGTITSATNNTYVCQDTTCAQYGIVNMKPTVITTAAYPAASQIVIQDTGLTGFAYGNQIGWINFAPTTVAGAPNTSGVTINPSTGAVSGYAYSEVGGWINFRPTAAAGNTSTVGVSINNSGQWNGWAWVSGNNGGWLKFDCGAGIGGGTLASTSVCITTDWRPIPARTVVAPSGGGGGGGGGGGIIISTPATTANNTVTNTGSASSKPINQPNESAPTLRADINDDHTVGIFDYNLLMVNWSSAAIINTVNANIRSNPSTIVTLKSDPIAFAKKCKSSNIADINCDNKVDVVDFNLVMINWGKRI